MSQAFLRAVAGAAVACSAIGAAQAATFTPFGFTSNVSTSGVYADGDVRLDSVTFGSTTLTQPRLQTVVDATILVDDGVDAVRGGHNLAAGRGISSDLDSWVNEGPATITPTSADLRDALGNFNLTSIVVTRENPGTASVEVRFAQATDRFFFWERGGSGPNGNGNSDLLVEALDDQGAVTASYKILRGQYTATGIEITTWNGSFASPSTPSGAKPRLGSIGLELDTLVDRLRLTSVQTATGGDNGPDYKVIAAAPVPLPPGVWMLTPALCALAARRRNA